MKTIECDTVTWLLILSYMINHQAALANKPLSSYTAGTWHLGYRPVQQYWPSPHCWSFPLLGGISGEITRGLYFEQTIFQHYLTFSLAIFKTSYTSCFSIDKATLAQILKLEWIFLHFYPNGLSRRPERAFQLLSCLIRLNSGSLLSHSW